ncbi:MAG: ArsA family ATPase [Acidobacteriota bacterium]
MILVTGKGGVGKSTVAAALAMVSSRHLGLKTMLVELDARLSAARLFGKPAATYGVAEVAERIWMINVTGREAVRDYLNLVLPVKRLTDRIAAHPFYRYFVDAAPGIKELLTFGKIWKLQDEKHRGRQAYDLVVVDGYPSGQTVNMLRAPLEVVNTLKVGPIASKARLLVDLMRDPQRSAFLLVTLPEEMPVAESIELHHMLTAEIQMKPAGVVVNAILPKRFYGDALAHPTRVQRAVRSALAGIGVDEEHAAYVYGSAHEEMRWRQLHEHYLKKMANDLSGPFFQVPFVFDSSDPARVVERVAEVIRRAL